MTARRGDRTLDSLQERLKRLLPGCFGPLDLAKEKGPQNRAYPPRACINSAPLH